MNPTMQKTPVGAGVCGECCRESSESDYTLVTDLLERIALGIERSNQVAREQLEFWRVASGIGGASCE